MSVDLKMARAGDVLAEVDGPPVDADALRRYAEASGDLNLLHTDREFASRAGFSDLVVHGMLNMARLGRLVTDGFPPESIRSFSVRFEGVLLAGQATVMRMSLASRADGVAQLDLLMTTPDARRIASGAAKISIPE